MKRFIRRSNRLRRSQSNEPFFGKENGEGSLSGPENAIPFFNQLPIQSKLAIGKPNDKFEQQADAMADQVVNRTAEPDGMIAKQEEEEAAQTSIQRQEEEEAQTMLQKQGEEEEAQTMLQKQGEEEEEELQTSIQRQEEEEAQTMLQKQGEEEEEELQTSIQRQEEEEAQAMLQKQGEEEEEELQAKSNNCACHAPQNLEVQLKQSKSSGQPISSNIRRPLERAFGANFQSVRIHTDSKAVQMNKQLHAHAFTHGKDIYFNSGQYRPESKAGQHLLAHELTHTLQQGAVQKIRRRAMPNVVGNSLGHYQIDLPSPPGAYTRGNISAQRELVLSQEDPGTFAGFRDESIARNLARQYSRQVTAIVTDDENLHHVYTTDLTQTNADEQFTIMPIESREHIRRIQFENIERRSTEVNRQRWVARVTQAFDVYDRGEPMEAARQLTQLTAETTSTNFSDYYIRQSANDPYRPGLNFDIFMNSANGRGGITRLPNDRTSPIPNNVLVIGKGVFSHNSPDEVRATFVHELTHFTQAQRSIDLLQNWRSSGSEQSFEAWLGHQRRRNRITEMELQLTLNFTVRDDSNTETLAHLNAFLYIYPNLSLDRTDPELFRSLYTLSEDAHWTSADRPLQDTTVNRLVSFFGNLEPGHQARMRQYVTTQSTNAPDHRRIFFRRLAAQL